MMQRLMRRLSQSLMQWFMRSFSRSTDQKHLGLKAQQAFPMQGLHGGKAVHTATHVEIVALRRVGVWKSSRTSAPSVLFSFPARSMDEVLMVSPTRSPWFFCCDTSMPRTWVLPFALATSSTTCRPEQRYVDSSRVICYRGTYRHDECLLFRCERWLPFAVGFETCAWGVRHTIPPGIDEQNDLADFHSEASSRDLAASPTACVPE